MVNTLVNNEPMAQQVHSVLKSQIIHGFFQPGDKIAEQALADQMGVSRSPVREAIRRLADEGMIDFIPRRGAYVKVYTSKQVADIFEARLLLEKYAASHLKTELLAANREKILKLRQRICESGREDYNALDAELHELLVQLCGNDTILKMYRQLYVQISCFREISLLKEDMLSLSTKAHVAILDAILNENFSRVERLVTLHLTESEENVRQYFSHGEQTE